MSAHPAAAIHNLFFLVLLMLYMYVLYNQIHVQSMYAGRWIMSSKVWDCWMIKPQGVVICQEARESVCLSHWNLSTIRRSCSLMSLPGMDYIERRSTVNCQRTCFDNLSLGCL